MNYLYGDSTPSPLKSNFLEFLRDATDFCVFVLMADDRIKDGKAKIRALEEESDAERKRLAAFIETIARTIESTDKGAADSPTAACGAHLTALVAKAHDNAIAGITRTLADEIGRIDADEAATRKACHDALATLLRGQDPPDATSAQRVTLGEAGRYEARTTGRAAFGLEWTIDMAVGEDPASPWALPLPISRFAPGLEIRAPQLSGWISKEVKTRPQAMDRHVVSEFVDDGRRLRLSLKAEGGATGFEFDIDPKAEKILAAKRVGPAEDASVGAFQVADEDVTPLLELTGKIRAAASELKRGDLVNAVTEGKEFREQPTFIDFVQRLIAMVAPIVHEITARSLTPNELIIRRLLSNDRREEVFVAKATLLEKFAPLKDSLRALFTPLGLDAPAAAKGSAASSVPVVRAELPASIPPPPLPRAASVRPPPAPPIVPMESPPPGSVAGAKIAPRKPPPPPPVSKAPAAPAAPAANAPARDSAPSRVAPAAGAGAGPAEPAADASPPATDSGQDMPRADGQKRNEWLISALKKSNTLSRNGRVEEAYREYASLFTSDAFADCQPEDQRQALKFVVFPKVLPAVSEPVRDAHRAALVRLKALTAALNEAPDFEMLGVTHLALEDKAAAGAAFTTALGLARARDPQSELVASLTKRISEVSPS